MKKHRKTGGSGFLLTVRHPSGVKAEFPLKNLSEYVRSVCCLYGFRWKARATAKALEKVNRLSMDALLLWARITSPYLAVGDQEDSQSQPPAGEDRPSGEASGNTDR